MKRVLLKIIATFLFCLILCVQVQACTIFLLTDADKTLFFNNEDYSNPATRIWFLPGTNEYYGVAYVGFDDDWAQGGVNTAGLAYDWVAGFEDRYTPDPKLQQTRGNPSERMLESCATVSEAIAFYKKYRETSFSKSRMMIADKTGASVIIGSRDGELFYEISNQSRGFGYGKEVLDKLLLKTSKSSIESGLPILRACSQQGKYATKYSSVYDLRSGEILLTFPGSEEEIKINLVAELAKGGHYYDLPDIKRQLGQELHQLSQTMKRFISDGYTPVANPDPTIDYRFETFIKSCASGKLKSEDCSPELWNQLSPNLKEIQKDSEKLGAIESFTLIERKEIMSERSYLYLIEFQNYAVLFRFVLDNKNRVTMIKSEAAKPK
jgi:hypothetical protein